MEQAEGFRGRCGNGRLPATPRRRSCPPFPSGDFTGIVRGVTPLSSACIRLHPDDDVAVAKAPLKAGTEIADGDRVLTLADFNALDWTAHLRAARAAVPSTRQLGNWCVQ